MGGAEESWGWLIGGLIGLPYRMRIGVPSTDMVDDATYARTGG